MDGEILDVMRRRMFTMGAPKKLCSVMYDCILHDPGLAIGGIAHTQIFSVIGACLSTANSHKTLTVQCT